MICRSKKRFPVSKSNYVAGDLVARFESLTGSMKIIYVAHPISGEVARNVTSLLRILTILNKTYTDVQFCAPYIGDALTLTDSPRGIDNCMNLIETECFDEIWLVGDKISNGMKRESEWFLNNGKIIKDFVGQL